jgi:hypothetical protein
LFHARESRITKNNNFFDGARQTMVLMQLPLLVNEQKYLRQEIHFCIPFLSNGNQFGRMSVLRSSIPEGM